ncbi:MAG: response regulator [Chloroflexi bacterium]|nr:response regulator [Chloroflexota bacterium]
MSKWQAMPRRWRELSITTKFTSAFGLLLALIVLLAMTSYVALRVVHLQTEASILTSTEIQHLTLEMNEELQQARRLERDFFLRYPAIGFSESRRIYAERAQEHIAQVITLSSELRQLISESDVSDALQESDVNLNLYLSAAGRYAVSFEEAVELVAQMATAETGLQAQLAQHSVSLSDILQAADNPELIILYQKMQALEKDYLLTRQRPLMQSAFNVAVRLHEAIELAPTLEADQKAQALTCLDDRLSIAEEIVQLDADIHSNSNEFDLQAEAIDPISRELNDLASQEIEHAHAQINRTNQLATSALAVIALVGLALAIIIVQALNDSVTRNIVGLTQTAGELQSGNLEARARIDSADELGQLGDTFNAMAARIDFLVHNLEDKVAERTAKLTAANEQLQQEVVERKRAEDGQRKALTELQDTQERLVHQERLAAVGQLAAGIAHDFNNILASIVLYTQMSLLESGLSAQLRERLEIIGEQSDHAAKLVQQILDFGRRAVIERRPLILTPFLEGMINLLIRTLPESIHIILECGPGEHVINADSTRIQQVILNLALNAREAMPGGGELRITVSGAMVQGDIKCVTCGRITEGKWVQVTVTDTGTGIPPDVLPHIFEPFFTTRAPLGSGLGLAQVYGIVKQHGGHIDVETQMVDADRKQTGEQSTGTTFTLYWPAMIEPKPESLTQKPLGLAQGNEQVILIVEDDITTQTALVNVLETLNYKTLKASNGKEALEIFEQHWQEISLVLSDWVMPLMDGIELVHKLNQYHSVVRVLMLTGHPLDESTQKSVPEGVVGWVQKPLRLEQLAEAIALALVEEIA